MISLFHNGSTGRNDSHATIPQRLAVAAVVAVATFVVAAMVVWVTFGLGYGQAGFWLVVVAPFLSAAAIKTVLAVPANVSLVSVGCGALLGLWALSLIGPGRGVSPTPAEVLVYGVLFPYVGAVLGTFVRPAWWRQWRRRRR